MWSITKKKLDNLMCVALRKRIKYHLIKYTEAHDQLGRICIEVDGIEKYSMCFFKHEAAVGAIVGELRSNPNYIPKYDSKYSDWYEAREIAEKNGVYADWHFFQALVSFLNNPIKASLESDNDIIRSLAVIDRRVGKRTLARLNINMENQTQMVQYFYHLRCDAEEISQETKKKIT